MSELDAGEEFFDSLVVAQNNADPDTSDAWLHADEEINDESSFGPTSSNENNEFDGIFDLFQTSRTTEGSHDESTRGGAFGTGDGETAANSSAINAPAEMSEIRYRSQPSGLKKAEKIQNCSWSNMGCAQCQETICTDCWKAGYDKHRSSNCI